MCRNRFQGRYEILRNEEIKPEHYALRIAAPEIATAARPGQFLHVLVSPEPAPLLRRPISISRVNRDEGWVEMIYRVVGEGTTILSRTRPGVTLDVMGPLGTPFRLPPPAPPTGGGEGEAGRHILVGGGVGIPPMLFLASELLRHPERKGETLQTRHPERSEERAESKDPERREETLQTRHPERSEERAESKEPGDPSFDSVPLVPRSTALRMPHERRSSDLTTPPTVLLGGRTAGLVLCEVDFASIGVTPRIATDDGSLGQLGLVTDLLREALADGEPATIYACGPIPMLRAVARTAREFNRPCQVSFEARMACGVGACLSCVIPTSTGYQRVCTEGPAFDAETVDWGGDLDVM